MSWEMQVQVNYRWVSIKATGAPEPYRYATQEEAQRMLEICYPDQCRQQRLLGTRFGAEVVRVIEVANPPNMD